MPVKEKKTSRAEFAYDTLKRRILDNQLPPGAMLSEVALAQKLNMSRTPIREAIRRLEQERILEDSGHGLVVIGIAIMGFFDL